jgi:acyl carrier protein
MLDPEFTAVLRPYLKHLPPGAEIPAATPLRALGLDSVASVALVLDLEDHLQVSLPDDLLNADTFATPASLWAAVGSLRDGSRTAPARPQA